MKTVHVAVVQAAPVAFDRERTLETVRGLAIEAADRGARLIVFPEAFVSGYPRGLDFGVRIGSRTPEGRELFRRYWDSAVDVPGPAVDSLGNTARDTGAVPGHRRRGARRAARSTARSCSSIPTAPCWASIAS